ncbi:hypothetical protein Angca_000072, partial [Angiostrongylus cantonensis]
IQKLLSRLKQISPMDVRLLANARRAEDNELVDNVLAADNIIKLVLFHDEELLHHPPRLGALILVSSNIAEYVKQHNKMM